MGKHNVIVKIESGKQAKRAKSVLKALEEPIWHSFSSFSKGFLTFNDEKQWTIIDRSKDNWVKHLDAKKEIGLKDLIRIVVAEKTSILTGKCAIAVNNEREFKLLMEHYEEREWCSKIGNKPSSFSYDVGLFPAYNDKFIFLEVGCNKGFDPKKRGYTIIPFADFAAECGIEVPVFVLQSEDGVSLYVGDDYCLACLIDGSWELSNGISHFTTNDLHLKPAFKSVWFSTREAAEVWIKEQNSPKHATIALFRSKDYKSAEITPDKITIRDGNDIYFLKPSDLEDMMHAYKSLQP
jgi:hypothetical protein